MAGHRLAIGVPSTVAAMLLAAMARVAMHEPIVRVAQRAGGRCRRQATDNRSRAVAVVVPPWAVVAAVAVAVPP